MADASRLKLLRRPSLGAPPPPEEARDLGVPPEPPAPAIPPAPISPPTASIVPQAPMSDPIPERIDGRTLRRSGRTVQFATRVSPEFDARIRALAQRDGLLLVEVLEKALKAYEQKMGR